MIDRGRKFLGCAVVAAALAACGGDTGDATTAPASQATGSAGSIQRTGNAALSCSVTVTYVFSAQNGTVISTDQYQKDFPVQPGVPFTDDFSTPTRQKFFNASVVRQGRDPVVTIDYFNDVGVFHSVSFDASVTLGNGNDSTSGSNEFSTSVQGLSGHHRTNYALTCQRA